MYTQNEKLESQIIYVFVSMKTKWSKKDSQNRLRSNIPTRENYSIIKK